MQKKAQKKLLSLSTDQDRDSLAGQEVTGTALIPDPTLVPQARSPGCKEGGEVAQGPVGTWNGQSAETTGKV